MLNRIGTCKTEKTDKFYVNKLETKKNRFTNYKSCDYRRTMLC